VCFHPIAKIVANVRCGFQNVKSEPPNHAFTFNYITISDGECKPTFEVYASENFQ